MKKFCIIIFNFILLSSYAWACFCSPANLTSGFLGQGKNENIIKLPSNAKGIIFFSGQAILKSDLKNNKMNFKQANKLFLIYEFDKSKQFELTSILYEISQHQFETKPYKRQNKNQILINKFNKAGKKLPVYIESVSNKNYPSLHLYRISPVTGFKKEKYYAILLSGHEESLYVNSLRTKYPLSTLVKIEPEKLNPDIIKQFSISLNGEMFYTPMPFENGGGMCSSMEKVLLQKVKYNIPQEYEKYLPHLLFYNEIKEVAVANSIFKERKPYISSVCSNNDPFEDDALLGQFYLLSTCKKITPKEVRGSVGALFINNDFYETNHVFIENKNPECNLSKAFDEAMKSKMHSEISLINFLEESDYIDKQGNFYNSILKKASQLIDYVKLLPESNKGLYKDSISSAEKRLNKIQQLNDPNYLIDFKKNNNIIKIRDTICRWYVEDDKNKEKYKPIVSQFVNSSDYSTATCAKLFLNDEFRRKQIISTQKTVISF